MLCILYYVVWDVPGQWYLAQATANFSNRHRGSSSAPIQNDFADNRSPPETSHNNLASFARSFINFVLDMMPDQTRTLHRKGCLFLFNNRFLFLINFISTTSSKVY